VKVKVEMEVEAGTIKLKRIIKRTTIIRLNWRYKRKIKMMGSQMGKIRKAERKILKK